MAGKDPLGGYPPGKFNPMKYNKIINVEGYNNNIKKVVGSTCLPSVSRFFFVGGTLGPTCKSFITSKSRSQPPKRLETTTPKRLAFSLPRPTSPPSFSSPLLPATLLHGRSLQRIPPILSFFNQRRPPSTIVPTVKQLARIRITCYALSPFK